MQQGEKCGGRGRLPEGSSFVTGANLVVDGRMTVKMIDDE